MDVIQIENISKQYRLGMVGTNTLRGDIARWWAKINGREDPALKIGDENILNEISGNYIWALKDINFKVKRGEIIGIIGKNGAGKTTLLKLLTRITAPTTGQIKIRGRIASLLEVGTGFHPELTGRENIFLNGVILGMTKLEIHNKYEEIVEFSGVNKYIDTPVKRYSSGMYVRLAFAVAAHLKSDILVVDEVLAVGDAEFQKKCLGKMSDISRGGRTVLFVSHNIQAIRSLCEHSVLLKSGTVEAIGNSSEVIKLYLKDIPVSESLEKLQGKIRQLTPDPVFHLKNVDIIQERKSGTNLVNGFPIKIKIEYQVFKKTDGLHVYFVVFDREGTMLFESISNGIEKNIPSVEPGHYISEAVIPENFLSAMQYDLHIRAGIHNNRSCIPEILNIILNINSSCIVNRAFPGYNSPGKLLPLIQWTNSKIQ